MPDWTGCEWLAAGFLLCVFGGIFLFEVVLPEDEDPNDPGNWRA